jgi:hypothetical protein
VKRKRAHVRVHGKLPFVDLVKTIAKKWRVLSTDELQYYQVLAKMDGERYKNDMLVFKRITGNIEVQSHLLCTEHMFANIAFAGPRDERNAASNSSQDPAEGCIRNSARKNAGSCTLIDDQMMSSDATDCLTGNGHTYHSNAPFAACNTRNSFGPKVGMTLLTTPSASYRQDHKESAKHIVQTLEPIGIFEMKTYSMQTLAKYSDSDRKIKMTAQHTI